MFLTHTAHPHHLSTRDYSSEEQFSAEIARVFATSWNVVCAQAELAKDGDQVAKDVGGVPILVRRDGGTLRAYRNVCAHRHTLVAPQGPSCRERLRCQYHGWEYGLDGRLTHLPDGASFRGWKATDARLD